MQVLYEDNHIIIVNKEPGEIVQGDKTGDKPLSETVKEWLKEKYAKPGNVFLGVCHRLDRPVGGVVVFAKTSKALTRLNAMFRNGEVRKTYRAIVCGAPEPPADRIVSYLTTARQGNKTYSSPAPRPDAKEAALTYTTVARGDRYSLLEINLETGRKHQIRVQLASIDCPIRGDLKYGAPRSNPDGGISLQATRVEFVHPVSGNRIDVTAPLPSDPLWSKLLDSRPDASASTQQQQEK